MTTIKRTLVALAGLCALALALALTASPALAAPQLHVTLSNEPTELPRTDERMTYKATVTNVASPAVPVGEVLTCDGRTPDHVWFENFLVTDPKTLSYQWLRNGAVIAGQSGETYTTTVADEHKAIQCMVTGIHENGVTAAVSPSQPPVLVVGQPATAIPLPANPAEHVRPKVSPFVGGSAVRTCSTAPMNWPGATSYGYQWLRNGAPIAGATSSEYTPVEAEDKGKILQCEVFPKNGEGVSGVSVSDVAEYDTTTVNINQNNETSRPFTTSANWTSSPVTLNIELPGCSETLIYHLEGSSNNDSRAWSCTTRPASGEAPAGLTCVQHSKLEPGSSPNGTPGSGSYQPLKLTVQLGEDAPEPTGTAVATVSGGGDPSPESAEATYTFTPGLTFGALAESFEAGVFDEFHDEYTRAGAHPFEGYTSFGFNVHRTVDGLVYPTGNIKDVVLDAPRGFTGNALAAPELCESIEELLLGTCPPRSIVGGVDVYTAVVNRAESDPYPSSPELPNNPLYAIDPEFGQPAQFGFDISSNGSFATPYTFVPELRADEGYAISFRTAPILTLPQLYGTNVNLCDFGAHTTGAGSATKFESCRGENDPKAYPTPLITNPTRCSGPPPSSGLRIDSWQHPAEIKTYDFTASQTTDCEAVKFEPEAELRPTNHEAETPTGLGVEFKMPTDGLLSPTGVSQANLDNATVTFPKGMSINAAAADGLSACTLAEIKLHSNAPDECPESSKVGTIEIDTPLIRKTLTGNIYVAQQNHNPFNATLGLYMSFASARDGVRIKVAGKVTPDPQTGQLVSTFAENPEAPFSRLALHFNEGPRAPLVNPPKCGTYAIHAEFSPWSAVNPANPTPEEIVSQDTTYQVDSGPHGSPCPAPDLKPSLRAGLADTQAGSSSPFAFSLSREDGSQRFDKVSVTTPPGLTAKLAGIPYCTDAELGSISGAEETGQAELANPRCPAASQVGTSEAGAGSGPFPFYAPGKVYLAGPYKGAPVSLAVVTPAVAGPFDLGNVIVRNPLYVDPVTSQVSTVSDPIPTILHGLVLDVRDVRVNLDRAAFTRAPTNCEPMAVSASVHGEEGADANLSNRFQVGGCEKLGFRPKLGFRLFGGIHRGSHPRLQATLTMPEGGANNASASVALPRSEFLDQAHIKTVCTRVQFAAQQCPAGSVYGEAEATTPLLDYPVRGPAILRSSNHQLPDLVLALKGPDSQPIEIDLDGRIDSIHGGIRTTFEAIPDQPVSSFTLRMQGGKKGLLINSRNICAGATPRATGVFNAQNGLSTTLRPPMRAKCGTTKMAGHHKKRPSRRRNGR